MSASLLELDAIHAGYDGIEVLHGVDLEVPAGQMLAILGSNGAGKTTLMRVISGLLAPTRGQLFMAGERVTGFDATALARAGVCAVPEGRGVFPNLTVRENLWMAAARSMTRDEVEARTYELFPRLGERRSQIAGTLSGGEQQMVAISRALVGNPSLVLLDELSTGLAPLIVAELLEHVRKLTDDGVTVIVVEQFARAVLPIVDMAGLLIAGHLQIDSPVVVEARLHEAYLGGARLATPTPR